MNTDESKADNGKSGEPKNGIGDHKVIVSPVVVDQTDLLRSANLHLKAVNLSLELKLLEQHLAVKAQARNDIESKIHALQKELEEKYGINFTTHMIDEESGRVIPRSLSRTMLAPK